ncbi:MAG: FGGY-family carbohydrate kinase [Anaerolineae bacterium]
MPDSTWLQILADIWQVPLLVPQYTEEATSLGAAVCGGVSIGLFPGFDVMKRLNPITTEIMPRREYAETYAMLSGLFNQAYHALVSVFNGLHRD